MSDEDRTAQRPWVSIREVPNGWTLRPADEGTADEDAAQVPQKVR